MPITPARMPLFDHLGELRRRVTIVVVSLFVTAIIIYFATPALIEILIDPIREFLTDGKLTVISVLGGFSLLGDYLHTYYHLGDYGFLLACA